MDLGFYAPLAGFLPKLLCHRVIKQQSFWEYINGKSPFKYTTPRGLMCPRTQHIVGKYYINPFEYLKLLEKKKVIR